MATATLSRQPFGSLEGSRLRNLSHVKNVQNGMMILGSSHEPHPSMIRAKPYLDVEALINMTPALPGMKPSSLKRRHEPSQPDDCWNSENVDPDLFSSPTKKTKTGAQNFDQPFKAAKLNLNIMARPINAMKSQKPLQIETHKAIESLKRKSTDDTPDDSRKSSKISRLETTPAGRSPKSKRVGILSRRRMGTSSFTRINPPSFSATGTSNEMSYSIDAALSGTVSSCNKKVVSMLDGSFSNGWKFDIREDTEGERLDNILQHSTCILDISDDEGTANGKGGRGKENIPPANFTPIANPVPVSRKDMMTDEPRTPLGDLNAGKYYAEGCDTNSFVIIPDEHSESSEVEKTATSEFQSGANPAYELDDGWKTLIAQVNVAQKSGVAGNGYTSLFEDIPKDDLSEVEIWESESAKGEDEAGVHLEMESTLALSKELISQI